MISVGQTLGNFQARLGLDSKDYAKGMINAEAASRVFGNSFTAFVSNPLLGSIEIFKNVGQAAISGSVEILGYAESIERLSQQTGASEPLLIALQKRLEIAGFSAERARQSFLVFNKFIADYNNQGPLANEVLRQTGVELDGLTRFDDVFRAMIEGLSQIENPALKASVAMRLFGEEAGHDVINAIGGGNAAIDEMIDQYTRLGFVINSRTNTQLASMNTHLGFAQQAIEGIKFNTIREFLLGINDDLELTDENIVRIAEQINSQLGPAANDVGIVLESLAGTLHVIAESIKAIQSVGTDVFTTFYAIGDYFDRVTAPGPDAETREATRRNRQRYKQQVEEFGL